MSGIIIIIITTAVATPRILVFFFVEINELKRVQCIFLLRKYDDCSISTKSLASKKKRKITKAVRKLSDLDEKEYCDWCCRGTVAISTPYKPTKRNLLRIAPALYPLLPSATRTFCLPVAACAYMCVYLCTVLFHRFCCYGQREKSGWYFCKFLKFRVIVVTLGTAELRRRKGEAVYHENKRVTVHRVDFCVTYNCYFFVFFC